MAEFKNDGGLQHGGRILIIGPAAKGVGGNNFYADPFNASEPSTSIQGRDHLGSPRAQAHASDFVSGSATLTLDSASANQPILGDEFKVVGRIANAAGVDLEEVFYLTEVGTVNASGAEHKVSVNFTRKVAGATVPVP